MFSCRRQVERRYLNYCHWLLDKITDGELDPMLCSVSGKVFFRLSGHANSQNSRYWSLENHHQMHEKSLHDEKIGVLCVMSGNRFVVRICFDMTVNTEVHLRIFKNSKPI